MPRSYRSRTTGALLAVFWLSGLAWVAGQPAEPPAPARVCPTKPCGEIGENGPPTYGSPCAPYWYVQADAVALRRDADEDRVFATLGGPDDPVLGTSDLDFEFQAGFQILLGFQFSPRFGVEFEHLNVGDWDEQAAIRDRTVNELGTAGNLFSPFSDFGAETPLVGLDRNDLVTLRATSAFEQWEINLRHRLPMPVDVPMQASFLYGLRFMDIRERFDYATESREPAPLGSAASLGVGTDNDLFGVQLGALARFHIEPRWWLDLRMKGALCANEAEQHTNFSLVSGAGAVDSALDRADGRTAYVGDISLSLLYYVTERLTLRVGYQALWVDGLALASENFTDDFDILTRGPAGLDDEGTLVYHGPQLGLGMEW